MSSSLIIWISKILTDLCLIRRKVRKENGKKSVKLKSSLIKFKNYSRQIPVPFKIYADFQCI